MKVKNRLVLTVATAAVFAVLLFGLVPNMTQAADPCTFTPASGISGMTWPCDASLLANYMVELNSFFYRLAIVLAVLMITIGGFQWLAAMGNASKISSAKETIEQAVIGLALAFTAYLIFSQIDTSFVQLKPLTITSQGEKAVDCRMLFTKSTCDNTSLHSKVNCRWDAIECPNGIPMTNGKSCCVPSSGVINGFCEDATIADCAQRTGCYIESKTVITGGFGVSFPTTKQTCKASPITCIETKADYQTFLSNYPSIRPQCCVSPKVGDSQKYAWANLRFNDNAKCALICGTSSNSGWTEVSNELCLNNIQ